MSIKNYILSIFDFINLNITKFGAIINSPTICSLSWQIALKRFNPRIKTNKKNILVLYRSIGYQDLNFSKKKAELEYLNLFYQDHKSK